MRHRRASGAASDGRVSFRDVLRNPTFAYLFLAETQSAVGDQLARVALAVLVFDRTGSIAATAVVYATTFLPAVVGGWLVAELGDHWSRRRVMVLCELGRAALFAAMCVSGMPLVAMLALVAVAVMLGPVYVSAEVSCLADVLDEGTFRAATGLRLSANQATQVVAFAAAGGLVAWLSPQGALLVNAATFLASAALVAFVAPVPPVAGSGGSDAAAERGRASRWVLWTDRRLRLTLAMTLLISFYVVPEALAVPLGRQIGASTAQIGFLLAAIPLGAAFGSLVLVRFVAGRRRLRLAWWMSSFAGLPLIVAHLGPTLPWVLALWVIVGVLTAYQVELTARLVGYLPVSARSRLLGAIGAALIAAQGIGVLAFGALAQWIGALNAITAAGSAGSVAALALIFGMRNLGVDRAGIGGDTGPFREAAVSRSE